MEYKLGNSKIIREWGETLELECPKCKEKTSFGVFTNFDTRLKAELPLFEAKNVCFLVCPKCSAVFTVDEQNGKTFRKGEKLAIGNYDLKELEKFD